MSRRSPRGHSRRRSRTSACPRTGVRIGWPGAACDRFARSAGRARRGGRRPRPVGGLTGLSDAELRSAPRVEPALRRFIAFAGDAVLVAHNARFDVGFVNRELERMTGKRIAAAVIDTVPLARTLLRDRIE